MNERIKQLAEQAGLKFSKDWGECYTGNVQIERFAELVRQDEREQLRNRTYHEQQLMDGQASLLRGRTEKESTLQEITDIGQEAHTDHPMRHWDRTCPACVAEADKQEPVAWLVRDYVDGFRYVSSTENPSGTISGFSEPLYTAPPKREWVGLTDEEIHKIIDDCTPDEAELEELIDFSIAILAVEAKLKERNT